MEIRKAIESYWFRSLILHYVKKMESADETAFWMDRIEVVPECRFDTGADTWQGKRHWENILWLRENKYINGFRKWNNDIEHRIVSKLQEERRRKEDERKRMTMEIEHHYSMMGITIR